MEITIPNPIVKKLHGKGIRAVEAMKSWSRENDLELDLSRLTPEEALVPAFLAQQR